MPTTETVTEKMPTTQAAAKADGTTAVAPGGATTSKSFWAATTSKRLAAVPATFSSTDRRTRSLQSTASFDQLAERRLAADLAADLSVEMANILIAVADDGSVRPLAHTTSIRAPACTHAHTLPTRGRSMW